MAQSDSARLASLALMTMAALAGCRGVLGIDEAPAGPGDADGAASTTDSGPDGTDPDGAGGDGDANAASDGAIADGANADGAARDGGFDGAVREVDLAYPAYPLPADSPPVANYSVDRGAVFDHTTGLEWEQTIAGAAGTWQQASDRCATLALAGKSDWRVPSRSDLISLLDLTTTSGPTVNRVVFPDGASEALWSSSIYAANGAQAWTVFFSTRTVIWQGRSSMLRTRCVRGTVEAATKPAHWAVSTLEAMDLQTGLVWQRAPGPNLVTFSGALVYCQGLEINGKRGFRVPSQRELISITDESATSGGVDTRVFSTGTTFRYWTTTASLTDVGEQTAVDVGYGGSTYHLPPGELGGVRCVR